MNKLFLVLGTAFICIVTGLAIGSVGELPTSCGERYGWDLVYGVFSVMATPAAMFYLAGLNKD